MLVEEVVERLFNGLYNKLFDRPSSENNWDNYKKQSATEANEFRRKVDVVLREVLKHVQHGLHNAQASAQTYKESAELLERQMREQARVCPKCPGGTQMDMHVFSCPGCGEPYPLQSLENFRAAEQANQLLRKQLQHYVDIAVTNKQILDNNSCSLISLRPLTGPEREIPREGK